MNDVSGKSGPPGGTHPAAQKIPANNQAEILSKSYTSGSRFGKGRGLISSNRVILRNTDTP